MPNARPALVVIPTYNERENLPRLVPAILAIDTRLDILVVDDSSPDGTGELADRLADRSQRVHVLHRAGKSGLGAAYAAGFVWALKRKYEFILSMDADFSHNPDDLPRLLNAATKETVAIGSRYVPGGRIEGWSWHRYLNSWGANVATKALLGLPVRDATAGFKCYPRTFLERLDLKQLIATGYAFQVEMLVRAHELGFLLLEVPIVFVDRQVGESKISGELVRSTQVIWRLALKRKGLRQFLKFALVGGLNTILDWLVYFALSRTVFAPFGQLGKQLAKAGSFVVSASSSYLLNRHWTFRSLDPDVARQAGRFVVVAFTGLALNNLIFFLLTAPQYANLPDLVALALATGTVMGWNFLANKHWTFKHHGA